MALNQSSRRCYQNRDKVSDDERVPKRRLELFWTVISYFRVMPVDGLHLSARNPLSSIELQIQGCEKTLIMAYFRNHCYIAFAKIEIGNWKTS